jgi:hypothetical protein
MAITKQREVLADEECNVTIMTETEINLFSAVSSLVSRTAR